jgi:cysteine desulfurase
VTVLPVDRHGLAAIAHAHGALVHTDAAQAAGKIPIDVGALDVDLLTVAGHKMYAPKGIAALYVRPGLTLEPVVRRRAGTRAARGHRERRLRRRARRRR